MHECIAVVMHIHVVGSHAVYLVMRKFMQPATDSCRMPSCNGGNIENFQ